MSVNSVNNVNTSTAAYNSTSVQQNTQTADKTDTSKNTTNNKGVVYEKGTSSSASSTKGIYSKDEIVARLKKDAEARTSQMRSLVEKMMTSQGKKIGQADDMWKFLASGKFTVSADVKAQAQADIADDGYWGVEQTSDRILEFAKALTGGDASKAEEMRAAFEKGFKAATGAWGSKLPDISQRTYKAVMDKFDDWAGVNKTETETES
ncbi:hypothetical protein E5329_21980 [Petralouisia muris]|jgi:hypothetical protein|uniref:Uncharacterized protein n=1 Tax=Petralouisia muris TaxID=3032872 RepID=A0AC61RRX9_9FIRM|nr:hypothetical protein [Petralouisia muris]TGY91288.1 hypothetical protein E5329_21980 [Petralouisia muris]